MTRRRVRHVKTLGNRTAGKAGDGPAAGMSRGDLKKTW